MLRKAFLRLCWLVVCIMFPVIRIPRVQSDAIPAMVTLCGFVQAVRQEEQFFQKWNADPAGLHAELLRRRGVARLKNESFKLPEMAVSFIKIKNDIDKRLSRPEELCHLTATERADLQILSRAFSQAIQNEVPYRASIDLLFEYLAFMDKVFKRLSPSLPNSIAKLLTEEKFDNLVSHEDLFIFFSFQPVDIEFFVKTRPAPIYIMGLLEYPNFALPNQAKIKVDGFYTEIGGFTHHDGEHARADSKIDFHMTVTSDTVQSRQRVRDFLASRIDSLKLHYPDMAQAVTILLFEILHERGLQYDLDLLKSYLDLPLFSKTTKDKWQSFFWDPLPGKPELFNLFDDAELWLREQIAELLKEHNIEASQKNKYVIHMLDKIIMKEGCVKNIEILDIDDVDVWLTDTMSHDLVKTSLYNIKTFGLVEVNPRDADFTSLSGKSRFLQTKFNQLLKLWKSEATVAYKVIEHGCVIHGQIVDIRVDKNLVTIKDSANNALDVRLDNIFIQAIEG